MKQQQIQNQQDEVSFPMMFDDEPLEEQTFYFERKNIDGSIDKIEFQNILSYHAQESLIVYKMPMILWPAAKFLCFWIKDNIEIFKHNKNILELGAGLGLSSIYLGQNIFEEDQTSNSSKIIVTDGDQEGVNILKQNMEKQIKNKEHADQIICDVLQWESKDDINRSISYINQKDSQDIKLFDFVIASDVIYAANAIDPLIDTIKDTLSKDGQCILINSWRSKQYDNQLIQTLENDFIMKQSKEIIDDTEVKIIICKFK